MDANTGLVLILFLAICLGVGAISAAFSARSIRAWYPTLLKPAGTPPDWIFGPVWTALYVLMAIAAWLVWREYGRGARFALVIFFGQLALNLAWSAIFFASRLPGVAFVEIIVLWLAIAFTTINFYWLRPTAALLLIPYLLWVTYAGYLNFGICRLNRYLVDDKRRRQRC